jgi:hypothetical protein
MEEFMEYLVKKQQTAKDTMLKCLIFAAAFILAVAVYIIFRSIPLIAFLGLFASAAVIYGAWVLIRSFNIEYEYILTSHDLDIDKIIARSRRKRLISIDLRNIEIMAPVSEKYRREFDSGGINEKFNASTGDASTQYFIKFSHKEKGMALLLFNPCESVIKFCKHAAPRKVFDA